jgi:hypothetical protein
MILDKNQVLQDLSFVENNTKDGDVYLCSCGHKFNIENTSVELKKELAEVNSEVSQMLHGDSNLMEEFGDLYKNINMSMHEKVECPSCKKSFLKEENRKKLITKGVYFVSGFKFEENESESKLYYSKIKFDYNSDFEFIEEYKYIRVDKKDGGLFYRNYNGVEQEFDLDEVVLFVNEFLTTDMQIIYNAFDLHTFIHSLSNLVVDRGSIDIMTEMIDSIKNRNGDIGLDAIKKVVIIFLGIIKYSNLSTIAMTKGPMFLYDMMIECKLPKPHILIENKITSPIKIFNFLAQNYVSELGKDISEEDKDKQEFVFKSKQLIEFETVVDDKGEAQKDKQGDEITKAVVKTSGEEKTLNINFTNNRNYKVGRVKDTGSGFGVMEAIEDGSVSKFIFKNITKFSDYKYIIKYFKLINKQEIVLLLQRYDLEFLSYAVDLLYFRDKVTDFKEFQRVLDIMIDFVDYKSKLPSVIGNKTSESKFEMLKDFDFIPYDDSLMMMTVLKFDRRRHFDKIKTWKELNEYHDNLVKYFKTIKSEEQNGAIEKFVAQFAFLEDRSNYDGPLEIKLLSTPAMIIKEGVELRHSGAAYAKNVASGQYLMGQVFDKDENRQEEELIRYTIGFKHDKYKGLVFDQIKGFANKLGSNRFKKLVMEWLEVKDVSFQPIKDLRIDDSEE